VNLSHLAEPVGSLEDTTVIYQGRWKKTKPQQPPLAAYHVVEPQQIWEDSPLSLSLGSQVSANTAFRQQFHYVYLNYHLPPEILDKSRPSSTVTRNWLLMLQDFVIQSPALEASIAAFFAAQLGRKNNDINLIHQSRFMYVSGLERFQQALRNPKTRLSDETLAVCMALSLYELHECPPGMRSTYMTHQRGALMLLQLRGPEACTLLLGHSLFLGLRTQSVSLFSSYLTRAFTKRP
jgi:hypothetical protein